MDTVVEAVRNPALIKNHALFNGYPDAGVDGPYAIALGPRCFTEPSRTTDQGIRRWNSCGASSTDPSSGRRR